LTLLLGEDDVHDSVDNVDVVLVMGDGSRWSGTVISLRELELIMNRWSRTGENLAGQYFICPDLIVVRNGGVDAIADVFREILRTGGPMGILQRIE
jgi:hypothetical protein